MCSAISSLPLRRPLSLMRVDADEGWVEVLFKEVGAGLELLALKTVGDTLDIMGPIGVGFSLEPSRRLPLLIGGGVGIPPMVFLADYLRQAHPGCAPFAALASESTLSLLDVHESRSTVAGVDQGTNACMALAGALVHVANRLASLAGFAGCFRMATRRTWHAAWLGALDKEQRDRGGGVRLRTDADAKGGHGPRPRVPLAMSDRTGGVHGLRRWRLCGVHRAHQNRGR